MPLTQEGLSETSPLLGSGDGRPSPKTPNGIIASGATPDGVANIGSDLERRDSVDESRAAQFAGNPEVKKQLKYIVPAVTIGVFLAAADQTIIISAYGRIGNELDALNLTSWIAMSYSLTLTAFQPLYGKLSDIFGRKTCLLWSYAIFGLGGLFCGLAKDINQLIAARVFQGIGGGGMTVCVSILLSDIVPLKERGVWQGIINIVYASGAGSGAPLGGLLADSVGWRWAFLGQAPICLLAFVTVTLVLKVPARENKSWRTNLRRVDFLGALVLVVAVFCTIFGLDRGSNVSWLTPISYGPLVASVFLFAIFIYVEMRLASEPMAPGHIIFDRSLFAAYMCNFFSFAGWMGALFYLSLFFQAVDELGASAAGIRLLPTIIAGVSGSLFGGLVIKKTEKYYWLSVIAYVLTTFGCIPFLLFTGLIANNTYGLSVGMVMCGFGSGIGTTTTLIALISNAAPEDQAVTTACSYLFRSLGTVVGLSLVTTVVQQALRNDLARELGSGKEAEKIVQEVRRSLDNIKKLDPSVADLVRDCYAKALRWGFGLAMIFCFGSLLAAVFLRQKRLSR